MTRRDPHSYSDSSICAIEHAFFQFRLDFEKRLIHGKVRFTLDRPSTGRPLVLDTRELSIDTVVDERGGALPWVLGPPAPVLGSRLEIDLPAGCRTVVISYVTSPDASALQWMPPELTTDKTHPFLFSQCQPHHARSIFPIQDSPKVRFRFTAEVEAPEELDVVMAASPGTSCRATTPGYRCHRFEMPQPIPSYLFAIAVGKLEARDISSRCRVYAEPSLVDAAAYEFAEVESMIEAAEDIFGPYLWDRFDFVVMPTSFPYGGMENPRLTFLTPTIIVGDRSCVNVLAHELAHSWTGNLVTNATMDDFWLNEGFTVWAERRIVERLKGPDAAELAACVGRRGLDKALAGFADKPELTKLRTDLRGIDPDEVFSLVPYEKGYLFLRALEDHLGRETFARLVSAYIERFRFRSVDTDDFVSFVESSCPGALAAVNATEWIDGPGIPADSPCARSPQLEQTQQAAAAWPNEIPSASLVARWSIEARLLFLEALPRPMASEHCQIIESLLELNKIKHCDIECEWLAIAAASAYAPALPRIEEYLGRTGRLKLLRPVYAALCKNAATRGFAARCFETSSVAYHPIARGVIGRILSCTHPSE